MPWSPLTAVQDPDTVGNRSNLHNLRNTYIDRITGSVFSVSEYVAGTTLTRRCGTLCRVLGTCPPERPSGAQGQSAGIADSAMPAGGHRCPRPAASPTRSTPFPEGYTAKGTAPTTNDGGMSE